MLRGLLTWCTAALNGSYGTAYDDRLEAVGESLTRLLPAAGGVPRARRPAAQPRRAGGRGRRWRRSTSISTAVLLLGYRQVKERLDVPSWATGSGAGLTNPAALAERFASLAKKRLAALIRGVMTVPGDELLTPERPILSDILGRHRPALPGRRPRRPLRDLPLLPQGRDPRLPPARGDPTCWESSSR